MFPDQRIGFFLDQCDRLAHRHILGRGHDQRNRTATVDAPDLIRTGCSLHLDQFRQRLDAAIRGRDRCAHQLFGRAPWRAPEDDVESLRAIKIVTDIESVAKRPDDPGHCLAVPAGFDNSSFAWIQSQFRVGKLHAGNRAHTRARHGFADRPHSRDGSAKHRVDVATLDVDVDGTTAGDPAKDRGPVDKRHGIGQAPEDMTVEYVYQIVNILAVFRVCPHETEAPENSQPVARYLWLGLPVEIRSQPFIHDFGNFCFG